MALWNYIRSKVRDSILGGVSDALDVIEGKSDESPQETVNRLRDRLALKTLPPPEVESNGHSEEVNGKVRRKAKTE